MDSMSLRVVGDEELVNHLRGMLGSWRRRQFEMAEAGAYVVEEELQRKYSQGPIFSRSALLYRSVHAFVELRGDRTRSGAGTPEIYAAVLETGMVIQGNPYLHFLTRDGVWVKTRQVRIPPFRAAELAADEAEPQVRAIYEHGVRTFVEG